MEGAAGGLPLAETAAAGGPALQQRPWPGRALLLLPSGLLPGPWWLHPTRTNQWGRGPAPTLVPPSKEKESCCASRGTPGEAGGTWLWEHHSSPPRMLHQRQSSCVLGEFRFTLLSGRGSGNAR